MCTWLKMEQKASVARKSPTTEVLSSTAVALG